MANEMAKDKMDRVAGIGWRTSRSLAARYSDVLGCDGTGWIESLRKSRR